jgi:glycosyltransferase involved in cell wall biosynthesis
MLNNSVLVVAPSRNTRGGITSVIKAYESSKIWENNNCRWIETYKDSNFLVKIFYFVQSLLLFLYFVPKYKIIHIHLSWWVTAIRKLPFFLIALLFNKKIIIHVHSGAEKIIESKVKFLYKMYFLKADCTIVLANSIKKKLLQKYSFKNVQVIYNPGINVKKITNVKKNIILFAGSLFPMKGYSDLIMAFSNIEKKYPDWSLTFAGNGEVDVAKKLCIDLGVNNKVNFTGWISGEKKEILFRESIIFCLPSYSEGFPMAVLDAWAYGLPVITTPVGGLTDVIIDKENALLFESGNIEKLTICLDKLISDERFRNFISDNSKKLVEDVFSIEIITEQIEKLYSEIIMG